MKRQFSWLLLAVAVVVAPQLFATCPTPPTTYYIFPHAYDEYTPDPSCVAVNGNASSSTLWCYSYPAWSIGLTNQTTLRYQFTAQQSYQWWDVDALVEFNDPTNSAGNWFEIWAYVRHNGVLSSTLVYSWDGTNGDISCQRPGGSFSAANGDTVEIAIYVRKVSSTANIQISEPFIYGYYY
jgi:hypothetical protein